MISEYNIRSVLRNSLFRGMDKQFFKRYYNSKDFYIAKEGEIIYSGGDESSYLYLIVQGEVRIKVSSTKQIISRYLYDFFGESEILHSTKRNSSAVAMNDTILYKVTSELINELCISNIKLGRNLKNVQENVESVNKEAASDEIVYQLPVEQPQEIDLTLSLEEISNDLTKELSDDELDKILEKQKAQQQFVNVMKKVGKVEGADLLNQELLDDFSDSKKWGLASG